jgi:hypothetical protein
MGRRVCTVFEERWEKISGLFVTNVAFAYEDEKSLSQGRNDKQGRQERVER